MFVLISRLSLPLLLFFLFPPLLLSFFSPILLSTYPLSPSSSSTQLFLHLHSSPLYLISSHTHTPYPLLSYPTLPSSLHPIPSLPSSLPPILTHNPPRPVLSCPCSDRERSHHGVSGRQSGNSRAFNRSR